MNAALTEALVAIVDGTALIDAYLISLRLLIPLTVFGRRRRLAGGKRLKGIKGIIL